MPLNTEFSVFKEDERLAVWRALSDLFLDTELMDDNYEFIAITLADSSYSLKELEGILYYEVYPVCKHNLLSIAGEWAVFNDNWIMENIAPRKNKRPLFCFSPFHKRLFIREWIEVCERITIKRKEKKQHNK